MMRLLILFAAVLLAACSSHKHLPVVKLKTDTVMVVKEHVEYIKDTAVVEIPVQVAAAVVTDSSFLENDYATSSAFIDTLGMLHHDLRTKPGKIDVPYLRKEERKDSIITAYKDKLVPYYIEKKLPWYDKIKLRSWWVIAIAAVLEGLWLICRHRNR